jgi:hypothetical protein
MKRIFWLLFFGTILMGLFCGDLNGPLAAQLVDEDQQEPIFQIGELEQIYSFRQRRNRMGQFAPDGSIGVVETRRGKFDFYVPNGPSMVRLSGTPTKPGRSRRKVRIEGLPGIFNHVAGGPVFEDPLTKTRFMIYHAEIHRFSPQDFYSVLGLAVAIDRKGLKFRDLGIIIRPNRSLDEMHDPIDIGGGTFVISDEYLLVYFRDYLEAGGSAELAVARISFVELLADAQLGLTPQFQKYFEGDWLEPGIGGRASPLEIGNPANAWCAVSYNHVLDRFVLAISQWTPELSDLYLATSVDGLNWTSRQPIDLSPREQFYPSIIGMEPIPWVSGTSFFIYYTDSELGGWNRWQDARFVRRRIDLMPPTDAHQTP